MRRRPKAGGSKADMKRDLIESKVAESINQSGSIEKSNSERPALFKKQDYSDTAENIKTVVDGQLNTYKAMSNLILDKRGEIKKLKLEDAPLLYKIIDAGEKALAGYEKLAKLGIIDDADMGIENEYSERYDYKAIEREILSQLPENASSADILVALGQSHLGRQEVILRMVDTELYNASVNISAGRDIAYNERKINSLTKVRKTFEKDTKNYLKLAEFAEVKDSHEDKNNG